MSSPRKGEQRWRKIYRKCRRDSAENKINTRGGCRRKEACTAPRSPFRSRAIKRLKNVFSKIAHRSPDRFAFCRPYLVSHSFWYRSDACTTEHQNISRLLNGSPNRKLDASSRRFNRKNVFLRMGSRHVRASDFTKNSRY